MRPPYATRTILLRSRAQSDLAIAAIANVPLDGERPLELLIREQPKARTLDQNAAYHAGPLRDIAEQAWVGGRQYLAPVWHFHFKGLYLPEDNDPDLALLVKYPETYRKWDFTPKGERVLIGSTTQLTPRGF